VVVPVNENAHPLPGDKDVLKRMIRVSWAVFHGLEPRLRVGIVVADRRAAERGCDTQRLQGSQHGGSFHQATIVGMQHHLVRDDVFPFANVAHDFTRQLTVFNSINLPADDFSAKDVHEQIQVKIDSLNRSRQIRDVPTEPIVGFGFRFSKHEIHAPLAAASRQHKKLSSSESNDGEIYLFLDTMLARSRPTNRVFLAMPPTAAQHSNLLGASLCSPMRRPLTLLYLFIQFFTV